MADKLFSVEDLENQTQATEAIDYGTMIRNGLLRAVSNSTYMEANTEESSKNLNRKISRTRGEIIGFEATLASPEMANDPEGRKDLEDKKKIAEAELIAYGTKVSTKGAVALLKRELASEMDQAALEKVDRLLAEITEIKPTLPA